jgi:choline kinase
MPADRSPTAVILAAGAGRRLGQGPKALEPIAGRALIDRALDGLTDAGIERALIVAGYHAEQVELHVGDRAQTVVNRESRDFENFVSLAVGLRAAAPGRVLVLNGDVILAPGVLRAVVEHPSPLVLGVCLGRVDHEGLKVELHRGRVVRLGKGLPPESTAGEFVGVSVLSQAARDRYLERVDTVRAEGRTDLYYEDVYSDLCPDVTVAPVSIDPGDWAEVDTPEDLAAARRVAARRGA